LSDNITLDITVIILAGPNITTLTFDSISNHIINKSMLVPKTHLLEFSFVCRLINFLENVLESTIISLQDSVLGAHIKWVSSVKSILKARISKSNNGLIGVIHTQKHSWPFKFVNLNLGWLGSTIWSESHGEITWLFWT